MKKATLKKPVKFAVLAVRLNENNKLDPIIPKKSPVVVVELKDTKQLMAKLTSAGMSLADYIEHKRPEFLK